MKEIKTVAVIGTGTIGAGWVACFLSRGLAVRAFDPFPASLERLPQVVAAAWPILRALDATVPEAVPDFIMARCLADAIEGADFVQESGPESEALKIELFSEIDAAAPPSVVIASSSSSLLVSRLQSACAHPERCLVGHPFNPPYLVPLVEIVAGPRTAPWAVETAEQFYHAAGKQPLVLAKEITGYIANRLQNAVFREAMHLVQVGAATIQDIDDAVRYGPGLRWAFMGPFLTYALGGGMGGMRRYFEIFKEEIETSWDELGAPTLTDELRDTVIAQAEGFFRSRAVAEVVARRDQALVEVLKATRSVDLTG
ncbi:3-hydroxyacyl-CoA dehydrogenase NAD-binding domain-containing protein [Rhodoligotrophos defluvii]|uniref:3-hydroxyacyl-CoA dehydrogenase NAD-binding domain-containing protein n=1 Tax=Rhodoligotrophos defluvii TaxID=2561934 RepID=UPI0010C98F05|nr:3-hydroxyacyl-CoA dehydrogenase NAD-binding domain-containing protein [Rhodoligotrophos defluvii]